MVRTPYMTPNVLLGKLDGKLCPNRLTNSLILSNIVTLYPSNRISRTFFLSMIRSPEFDMIWFIIDKINWNDADSGSRSFNFSINPCKKLLQLVNCQQWFTDCSMVVWIRELLKLIASRLMGSKYQRIHLSSSCETMLKDKNS